MSSHLALPAKRSVLRVIGAATVALASAVIVWAARLAGRRVQPAPRLSRAEEKQRRKAMVRALTRSR